jgi:hypothetical protein
MYSSFALAQLFGMDLLGVGSTLRYFEAGALSRPGVTVSAALRDLAPLNNTSPTIQRPVGPSTELVRSGPLPP